MQYTVNENVIHPQHGAGVVKAVENQELVEGFVRYYVIDIPTKNMTVRVPVRTADKVGIRPAISVTKLGQVMETLQSTPHDLPGNFKERQSNIRKQVQSGRAVAIAEAIRDLAWYQKSKHLSKTDADLLGNARRLLGSEIAAVTGESPEVIQANIDRALKGALSPLTNP